jgi:CBS domain-containing protein
LTGNWEDVTMNTRDIMTANPTVVTEQTTITAAARTMRTLDVGMLPVVDSLSNRQLIGVITDRDIVLRCCAEGHSGDCRVEGHATHHPLATVADDATLAQVAWKMEMHQVRRLPVVDANQKVIGVVTQADLARRVGPTDPKLVETVMERVSAPTVMA